MQTQPGQSTGAWSPRRGNPSDGWGRLRQRACACVLMRWTDAYERMVADRRRSLLRDVEGDVVEVGPGAGANFPYLKESLPRIRSYTGIEPNPYLHDVLRQRAQEAGIQMELVTAPLGKAGVGVRAVERASVDVVICTLVLCSVPDPAAVVAEMGRMLRPGGRLLFMEHVAAPHGTWQRWLQRVVRPGWRFFGDGCEPDRQTEATIRHAEGFEEVHSEHFRVAVPVVWPHIAGMARRA